MLARVDADPHHGEANHGMQHSGPEEMGRHHQQSKSWNYGLQNTTREMHKQETFSAKFIFHRVYDARQIITKTYNELSK